MNRSRNTESNGGIFLLIPCTEPTIQTFKVIGRRQPILWGTLDTYMLQFINPEQFRTYCQNGQIRLNSNIAVIDDDEQSQKALNI